MPAIKGYARRVAAWEKLDGDPIEVHIQRCAPCYGEFLDVLDRLRVEAPSKPLKVSWLRRRSINKTLDHLENVMKSATQAARQNRETRAGR